MENPVYNAIFLQEGQFYLPFGGTYSECNSVLWFESHW